MRGSRLDLEAGRTKQKLRTRQALLKAARDLLAANAAVTVTAAANRASISKATAYRYFTTTDALVREAILDSDVKSGAEVIGSELDVRKRVLRVHRFWFEFTRRNEAAHRLFLAKTLEAWADEKGDTAKQRRGARRLPMFELALEPVRQAMAPATFRLLVQSLTAASGIETYVALKDVCKLSDRESDKVAESTLLAILKQHLPAGV